MNLEEYENLPVIPNNRNFTSVPNGVYRPKIDKEIRHDMKQIVVGHEARLPIFYVTDTGVRITRERVY